MLSTIRSPELDDKDVYLVNWLLVSNYDYRTAGRNVHSHEIIHVRAHTRELIISKQNEVGINNTPFIDFIEKNACWNYIFYSFKFVCNRILDLRYFLYLFKIKLENNQRVDCQTQSCNFHKWVKIEKVLFWGFDLCQYNGIFKSW